MNLPPALTVPWPQLSPRGRRVFFWTSLAGLLVVLADAAGARFAWSLWPISDPDTWGYLHPGLARLRGEGFQHTYGRNFLYPGWVWLLLRLFGDFRAIPVAQHLLGLATGGLLWTAWRQWRAFLTNTRLPAWVDALLGLALTTFFLRSASVVYYENQIRPEAVFPFCAALQVCALFAFLRAWGVDRHPLRAAVRGGASVFLAVALYQLKPSFGLAAGLAALPILWAFLRPWTRDPLPRRRLAVGVGVGGALAAVLFVLPERRLARTDEFSGLFLPETLLTVHAGLVRDQLVQDARDRAQTPFDPALLQEAAPLLDQETRRASQPEAKPYPSLGYNPDYLMYRQDSFCHWLLDHGGPRFTATFCYYYYQKTALRHPLRMAGKVGRQLGVFYRLHCPAFWPARRFAVAKLYGDTGKALAYPNYQEQLRANGPGRAYLDAAARLQDSPELYRAAPSIVGANVAASVCYLPILGLFLAGMGWVSRWPGERRAGLWAAGWLIAVVHGLCFGNCLTISIVHSLDVDRYGYNLVVYAAWCELAALLWVGEVAAAWFWSRRPDLPIRPAR